MSTLSTATLPRPAEVPAAAPPAPREETRYVALDAFRGFIMFTLASEGFGFGALRGDPTFGRIASWFDHVDWTGGVFWDMIQPSFMFMVGVAMPFALARRRAQGATSRELFKHISGRTLSLLLLSQFLIIVSDHRVHFQLINVLSQMAFTYFLTYLILQMEFRWQALAALLLLVFHTAMFMAFPGPEGAFSRQGNVGAVIDKAIGFNYSGYYVTINFISSTVTTLFGAWTGALLMGTRPRSQKLKILAGAMLAAFAGGFALSPLVPIVKRIWTASFTLYSTGWVLFMMIGFVLLIDVWGLKKPAFPLLVVGMNSIFIYSAGFMVRGAVNNWIGAFSDDFRRVGVLAPVAQNCAVMLVLWYLCYWLYRHKIFIRL